MKRKSLLFSAALTIPVLLGTQAASASEIANVSEVANTSEVASNQVSPLSVNEFYVGIGQEKSLYSASGYTYQLESLSDGSNASIYKVNGTWYIKGLSKGEDLLYQKLNGTTVKTYNVLVGF